MAARTEAFLQHPRQIRIEGGKLLVSRYFDWYPKDFTAPDWRHSAPTIAAFITRGATPEVARFLANGGKISFLDYDWSLNAARPGDAG